MLASKIIARGIACICVAVAACAVQAKPGPANPFRPTDDRDTGTAPVANKPADIALDERDDNPFRGEEAKPLTVAVEGAQRTSAPQEEQQPRGKDEVFFPFACESFASESVLLANPLAVKAGEFETSLIPAAAEEVATPKSQPYQKPIGVLGVNISLPKGTLPKSESQVIVSHIPFAGNLPRPWPSLVYHWEAAATWHQPLYFEEVNAERYGYQCNWVAQPFVSTAHFFGTLPALPYLMTVNCPRECVYTLGNYRPGSCPPWRRHCIPCYEFGLW